MISVKYGWTKILINAVFAVAKILNFLTNSFPDKWNLRVYKTNITQMMEYSDKLEVI